MTFADAAEAWILHGEVKRNLKRGTLKDYRQVLDAYLLPAPDGHEPSRTTVYGRAPFATTPLRDSGRRRSRGGSTACRTGARRRS